MTASVTAKTITQYRVLLGRTESAGFDCATRLSEIMIAGAYRLSDGCKSRSAHRVLFRVRFSAVLQCLARAPLALARKNKALWRDAAKGRKNAPCGIPAFRLDNAPILLTYWVSNSKKKGYLCLAPSRLRV